MPESRKIRDQIGEERHGLTRALDDERVRPQTTSRSCFRRDPER